MYYLFGYNPKIASYTVTLGSYETEELAQLAKIKCEDNGWDGPQDQEDGLDLTLKPDKP